jgi:hypothetical protein
MGFKEILSKIGEKRREKKQLLREIDNELHVRKLLEDRQKSANERELERFMKEEREAQIKDRLEFERTKRKHDITFNHNILNTPNITNHVDWEVLREPNMFKNNKNIFTHQEMIHKNNPHLFDKGKGVC